MKEVSSGVTTFTTEYSEKEILNCLLEQNIIDESGVAKALMKKNIQEVLKRHPYKIYQGSGRWNTYVVDETKPNNRRKISKSTEEKLYEELYNYYILSNEEKNSKVLTLDILYPEWLKFYSTGVKESTVIRTQSDWNRYYASNDIIHVPIKDLNKIKLTEWAHNIIKEFDMSKKQYYNCRNIIHKILVYCVDIGELESNPMDQVKIDARRLLRKVPKKPDATQVYSRQEYEDLKKLAWEDFYNEVGTYPLAPLAVLIMFLTGVRIGEVCTLKYNDIMGLQHICVQRMLCPKTHKVIEQTKGNHGYRIVPLPSEAIHIIECAKEYQIKNGLKYDEYIFSVNGNPLSYSSVAYRFEKYCKKMGIMIKSSHKARKSYISLLIDNNLNINSIRQFVGHQDELTTYNNYCFDRSTEDEKIKQIENAFHQ